MHLILPFENNDLIEAIFQLCVSRLPRDVRVIIPTESLALHKEELQYFSSMHLSWQAPHGGEDLLLEQW